jgi:pimeloyl-ACP methyl ester carboxylesterase
MAEAIRRSYRHSTPFDSGFLSVGSIHKIHYEQYGNKDGRPGNLRDLFRCAGLELILTVVFLHGGPGGSTSLKNTIYFNPSVYRVILFDQRGCGSPFPQARSVKTARNTWFQTSMSSVSTLEFRDGTYPAPRGALLCLCSMPKHIRRPL